MSIRCLLFSSGGVGVRSSIQSHLVGIIIARVEKMAGLCIEQRNGQKRREKGFYSRSAPLESLSLLSALSQMFKLAMLQQQARDLLEHGLSEMGGLTEVRQVGPVQGV